ncbi:MAG: AraC family transcriptional regulator [Lachnospiraceae bacterium]|nr:AraC family transcriptional regulator [Lachnospiraceae bacterium]
MQKILIVAEGVGKYNYLRSLIEEEQEDAIIRRCTNMSEAADTIRSEGADIVVADVSASFADVKKADEAPFSPTKGNAKQDLGFIKQYIRNHYSEAINNKKLAAIVHLTPNYLCTLFRQVEKITVRAYIEKVRLEQAAYLLIAEKTSVNDISALVGYKQPSYFCRVFRNYYNETPSEYRLRRTSDGWFGKNGKK